jgi:uncharacterized protein (DUF952 family)
VSRIYKILTRTEWLDALATGVFHGSAVDRADGFIHFSSASQASETARRHFHGQPDLVVLEVESERLGEALKWERSRGGELFPHLRGVLTCAQVILVRAAPLDEAGAPRLGPLAP